MPDDHLTVDAPKAHRHRVVDDVLTVTAGLYQCASERKVNNDRPVYRLRLVRLAFAGLDVPVDLESLRADLVARKKATQWISGGHR